MRRVATLLLAALTMISDVTLPAGWKPLRAHAEQAEYFRSATRFNIAVAGRRSGKSDIGRRRIVMEALRYCRTNDGLMTIHAPTRDQVKRIHWEKLKELIPDRYIARRNGRTPEISEGDLEVRLAHNNCVLRLIGMDKPMRAEGLAIDRALIDEIADMKPAAWALAIRPSLSTDGRPGAADFIGKPRGQNHLFDLWRKASTRDDWRRHHWTTASVLGQTQEGCDEIAAARRDMDELQYRQEYEAEFVLFAGRAYYAYDPEIHATHDLEYDPTLALELTLDFNVDPGTACVMQRQDRVKRRYPGLPIIVEDDCDVVLWEHVKTGGSTTRKVCRAIVNAWGHHTGPVIVYGDSTGGNRHSSSEFTDWEEVQQELRAGFRGPVIFKVPKNPYERTRVNTLNASLLNVDDRVRMILDKRLTPMLQRDLASVPLKQDGSGEIDKKYDLTLTHLSDGVGYRACVVRPLARVEYYETPLAV